MSWNAIVFSFRHGPPVSMAEVREEDLAPLGSEHDIRDHLSAVMPNLEWSSPRFGSLRGDRFGIEFTIPDKIPIEYLWVRVVGGGDVIGTLLTFTAPAGWSAFDIGTGGLIDASARGSAGWDEFQAYRDRVVARDSPARGG